MSMQFLVIQCPELGGFSVMTCIICAFILAGALLPYVHVLLVHGARL